MPEHFCTHLFEATPLMWKLSEGLGRGLSLDPGCVYIHLFVMASLMLNSLKVGDWQPGFSYTTLVETMGVQTRTCAGGDTSSSNCD